ncbi:MAG: hypothetical protein UFP41_00015 [Bacilli bacterium]|jgi:uncharacterized metal-binding protein YceD (DUF177 family)|nr:hypothetical protein [Bacilli bacterium]
MTIDLFNLVVNNKTINIDSDIIIPNEYLENSGIRRLNNIHFKGNIKKLVDDTYSLEGVLSGTMILADDITLEDYEYNFTSEIEENIEETSINLQKTLDITDILWQNILIEVPSKVVNDKNKNIKLEGNGWRLISEDDLNNKNNPLSELEDLLRKE